SCRRAAPSSRSTARRPPRGSFCRSASASPRRAAASRGRRAGRARRAEPSAVPVKIATWNVNGIRARQAQLCEWLQRDLPDIVCLQELKAETAQIPEPCKLPEYHVYWHGLRAYSGVSLHVKRT